MNNIQLIKEFQQGDGFEGDKQLTELYNGPFRRIVEVRLANESVLSRHHAAEPITVYCISGTGVFLAGEELTDSQALRSGTFITLEAGVPHEVRAEPALHLIVSKFKSA
jgi:quercetin dioxygenase-like cupin family protein